jgi:hypothetical protein
MQNGFGPTTKRKEKRTHNFRVKITNTSSEEHSQIGKLACSLISPLPPYTEQR